MARILFLAIWLCAAVNGKIVLPDALGNHIELAKPALENEARLRLPGSLGSCTANAPAPCEEMGELYSEKTTWYSVAVRCQYSIGSMCPFC